MSFVVEGNWLDVDWDAVGAIATVVGVLAAGLGAYLAWTGIQRQIAAAEAQHRQLLSAARRPHLVLRRLTVDPLTPGFLPQGEVANIGAGPAISPAIDLWIFPSPNPGLRGGTIDKDIVGESETTRTSRGPDARTLPGSIGAGQTKSGTDANPLRPFEIRVSEGHQLLVAWRAEYHDLDGLPYTSAGSIPLTDPQGELISHDSLAGRPSASSTM